MRGYLDTPSMGLPVRATVDAMTSALQDWAAGRAQYGPWEESMESCRALFARLAGVRPDQVGLLPSVVPAVSAAAGTLARGSGTVVAHRLEFRSLLLPVLAQVPEERMRWVDGPYVAGTFAAAVDESTDGVVVSAVASHDGGRPALAHLSELCANVDARLVVDGTQAAGLVVPDVPLDALSLFACAGYKGLRGPRGVAFAVAEDEHVRSFRSPSAYGAADGATRGTYGPPLALKPAAPGLDQSPAWLAWVGAEQALLDLTSRPAAERERHVTGLADIMRRRLEELALASQRTDLPSPIVSLEVENPDAVVAELSRAGVRAAARLGRLRFGFHDHNDENDVDRACDVLEREKGAGAAFPL